MSGSKTKKQPKFSELSVMFLITVFQLICAVCVVLRDDKTEMGVLYVFLGYIIIEWLYLMFNVIITENDYFELEAIAFFLSGIGLTICSTLGVSYALKQLIAIVMGMVTYLVVLLLIRDVQFAQKLRLPAAICSILLLLANLVLAKVTNGAKNWIDLGFFSFQPSELVKVVFILVGAVTLDKLLTNASIAKFIGFSLVCIGCLFVMRDFGAALIFFFTFILIAYMRSGDMRTIFLICAAAAMGAVVIIYSKSYVANRFAAYRHVWEYMDTGGYQQTRVLIYIASGGLLGLGLGEGKLRDIFAASTDLVFGVICEEMGLLIGIAVLLAFACIAIFAIKAAKNAASTFYSIAAVAASGMLLFQLALNVFGITDILPLTGVTLPFVSRGGSSLICSWGLLAYIRAAGAPFRMFTPDMGLAAKRRQAARAGLTGQNPQYRGQYAPAQQRPVQQRAPRQGVPQQRPVQQRAPQQRVPQQRPVQQRAPQQRVPQQRPVQQSAPQQRVPQQGQSNRNRRGGGSR